MPKTINSTYVLERFNEAEKKRKIAAPLITAHAAKTVREVAAIVNADMQRRGFKHPLNDTDIREMRHAARKAKGLKFDGLSNMPPKDRASLQERRTTAREFAFALLKEGKAVTASMVQKRVGIGYETATHCVVAARRMMRNGGSTPMGLAPASGAPPQTQGAVPSFALAADTRAALELLTQALAGEGIITMQVSKGEHGAWGYSCTRRVVEDGIGVV